MDGKPRPGASTEPHADPDELQFNCDEVHDVFKAKVRTGLWVHSGGTSLRPRPRPHPPGGVKRRTLVRSDPRCSPRRRHSNPFEELERAGVKELSISPPLLLLWEMESCRTLLGHSSVSRVHSGPFGWARAQLVTIIITRDVWSRPGVERHREG